MSSPNASIRWPKCTSARASQAGAEQARRDTIPGGGGALAAVHSGQDQAAAGQHDGSALLQPGLTCTGRTETLLSSGARHRIWANFDRRHSSPRARSDKMLTVRKLRLVQRKRLPCEPAAGRFVVDCRGDFYGLLFIVRCGRLVGRRPPWERHPGPLPTPERCSGGAPPCTPPHMTAHGSGAPGARPRARPLI